MNRQIKFRIWSKIDLEYLSPLHSTVNRFYESWILGLNDIFNHEDYIFQQFTGLTDENGKEIYEGDKVVANGGWFSKLYKDLGLPNDENQVCEGIVTFHKGSFTLGDYALHDFDTFAVIGNIFKYKI